MTSTEPAGLGAASDIATLLRLCPAYRPTPLRSLPLAAKRLGVREVLAKDEGCRMLGSFKSLGGTYAGLRALGRAASVGVAALLSSRPPGLPRLICASDGNHGLAVAAASRLAGAPCRIYLHEAVSQARSQRIAAQGAEIAWIRGTYDDAVREAAMAARGGGGILVADTSGEADDPAVCDVMTGYGVIATEIMAQVEAAGCDRPTHCFVQAGVGGLAAAMAERLGDWMAAPAELIVVEPDLAASVAAAMQAGSVVRVPGKLDTCAGMLACGEASAPALRTLQRCGTRALTVTETALSSAPGMLRAAGGPDTTASGAAGYAGALDWAGAGHLRADSRVLILVTEGILDGRPALPRDARALPRMMHDSVAE